MNVIMIMKIVMNVIEMVLVQNAKMINFMEHIVKHLVLNALMDYVLLMENVLIQQIIV